MTAKGIFVTCLLSILLILLIAVQDSVAEAVDEFDLPGLNEELWDMQIVGDAEFEISDGILTMMSPSIDSGAMVYYPVNVEDVDITFEVNLDTSGVVDNITVGFIADLMEPQINTDINNHWEANFFFVPANWYIKQDPVVIGEKPPNPPDLQGPYDPEWNVVKIDSSESKSTITFFLNGKEVGEVEKNQDVQSRYFYITCDPYTSHYTGEVAIDYIKIGGPGAPTLAVQPTGKLTTTWAREKQIH